MRESKFKSAIGQRFHNLTVTQILDETNRFHERLCLCHCHSCGQAGHKTVLALVVRGRIKSCPCSRGSNQKRGKDSRCFKGFEGISGYTWGRIKSGARNRRIPFNISIEEAWNVFCQQKALCALSGVPIVFGQANTNQTTASLDRIDSSQGYVLSNIQWVHKDINQMKMDLPEATFKMYCRLVFEKSVI